MSHDLGLDLRSALRYGVGMEATPTLTLILIPGPVRPVVYAMMGHTLIPHFSVRSARDAVKAYRTLGGKAKVVSPKMADRIVRYRRTVAEVVR